MGATPCDCDGGGDALDFGWGVCPHLVSFPTWPSTFSPSTALCRRKSHTGMKASSGKCGSMWCGRDVQRDGKVNRGPIAELCGEVISPT